jgi:predicted RNA binding protein YcfA (HicA-like mRNA interferase family)
MSGRLPSVSTRDVVRAFERAGFQIVPGQGKGSHIAMARENLPNVILVIPHRKDVSRGLLRALIRQSGMTVEQFVELL